MGKNALIYIISPTHVISSISAIKALHKNDNVEVTVIVHWPGVSTEIVEELAGVVKRLIERFPFVKKIVTISSERLSQMLLSSSIEDATIALQEEIGSNKYHEIYYSHDVVGQIYQFLCTMYPAAYRICFGDALGNVYEKHIHLSYMRRETDATSILSSFLVWGRQKAYSILRRLEEDNHKLVQERTLVVLEDFKPHQAVLILPVDQSGNFLKDIPLTVCQKDIVLDVIKECAFPFHELRDYTKRLLDKYSQRYKYILLTENYAEGNFIDFDKEIDMWCSIIKENCTHNSVVFLKSHPGETLPRNTQIKKRLGNVIEVVELDKRFSRYPIEIWQDIVLNCTVVCMSYPVLSLKFLYDIDVIQPMDNTFIEMWFPEWTWASYKNSLSLYMEPLKRLLTWDGKSVLWAGTI